MAGGTHHAHKNFGSGYCVFNDLSYASKTLIKNNLVKKILIIDLDVHQGDGTAKILQNNKDIFTCSVHCKNNFPFRKTKSDLDIELDDNVNDNEYIENSIKDCVGNHMSVLTSPIEVLEHCLNDKSKKPFSLLVFFFIVSSICFFCIHICKFQYLMTCLF